MKYNINNTSVVIYDGNHEVKLPKLEFSNAILNEAVLEKLSFEDLQNIWKSLYGIPANVKQILLKKNLLYSSSSSINSFFYNGNEYWLDKDNRTCLWNLSNSSLGDIEFIVGDKIVEMSSIKLKAFLLKLEVYAYKCFVNTFKHEQTIKDLQSLEDIINYNYTTGYPDKITLE